MALSIKSVEADRLARELASLTGKSLTQIVTTALKGRLDRDGDGTPGAAASQSG
jgi:antitoxin VapB